MERLDVVVDVDREAVRSSRRGETWTPTEAILRSSTQTPVYPRPLVSRERASIPTSPSAATIARSIVRDEAGTSPTRMIG